MSWRFPGVLAVVLLAACGQNALTSAGGVAGYGQCLFPRACYRKHCTTCQQGPESCRATAFYPAPTDMSVADRRTGPGPADPGVVCLSDLDDVLCSLPEEVCGPRCYGFCVRQGQSCASTADGGQSGGGGYCPFPDDMCCTEQPDAALRGDGGGALDGPPPRG